MPHGGSLNTLPMSVQRDFDTLDIRYDWFMNEALKEREEKWGQPSERGGNALRGKLSEDYEGMFQEFSANGTDPIQWG